jgi:hypothetical protein
VVAVRVMFMLAVAVPFALPSLVSGVRGWICSAPQRRARRFLRRQWMKI